MSLCTKRKGERSCGGMKPWPAVPGASPLLLCFENVWYEKVNICQGLGKGKPAEFSIYMLLGPNQVL